MSVEVGVLSCGTLGRLAADFPGWQIGESPADLPACPVVLADVQHQLTFDELEQALGPQREVFLVQVEEGGSLLSPAVFLCPSQNVTAACLAEVVSALQRQGCEVYVLSIEQLKLAQRLVPCFLDLLGLAAAGMKKGAIDSALAEGAAQSMVQQTLLGTAALLFYTQSSPAMLKDRVTSPAGTTIAGLAVLEERAVRGAYIRAVEACVTRE